MKRRQGAAEEISYWKNALQEGVDFVLSEGSRVKQLIQATASLSQPEVRKRELRALLKAGKELRCGNLVVVTLDHEATEVHGGARVRFVPLWKWLLRE